MGFTLCFIILKNNFDNMTFPMFPKTVLIKMPPYPPIFPSIEGSIPDQYASSLVCFSNLYRLFTMCKVIMHILYKNKFR